MKKTNKVLSLVLAVLLCVGMLPISTLTAFAADTYTVTFEVGEGTGTVAPMTATFDTLVDFPEGPTPPEGMAFFAWVEDVNTENYQKTGSSFRIKKNTTYHAVYFPTDGSLIYRVNEEDVYIMGYTSVAGRLVIPATFNDKPITRIYQTAFQDCQTMTSAVLPEGLVTIDEAAFHRCRNLESVDLPNSLQNIDILAFERCSSLKTVEIPDGVTCQDRVFGGCSSLEQITFPSNMNIIPSEFLIGCSSLTELTLPAAVKTISYRAFASCHNLKKLVLPEGLQDIDMNVFEECNALSKIIIPRSVNRLYKETFFLYNGTVLVYEGSYAHTFCEDNGIAYALVPSVQVGQVNLYDGEYTTDGRSATTTKPESGGYAYFKDGVLTLNNFTYTGNGSPKTDVIYAAEALAISVVGTNTINATDGCAMNFREGYVIDGDGVLNLIGGLDCINGNAQYPSEIKNITLNATARRRVLISGKFSIVNAKLNLTSEDVSSGIRGGAVVIKDSEIVSNATISAILGDLEVENSKIVVSGETALFVNDGLAVRLIGGNITISGNDEDRGAIYVENSALSLPTADYWWRTSADGEFTKNGFVYNKQAYIEITTTKPSGSITDISNMDKVYDGLAVSAPTVNALSTGIKTFKYKVKGADDSTYTTEAPTNAGEYTCLITVAADDNYTEATATKDFIISKATPTAPTTPVGVNTTYIDTTDGKITGVDSTMEYRKDGETNCTAVTGTEITNLAAGTYYVRYAETANYNPSPEKVITISLGGKRTPTVDTEPTASRVIIGGKLSDSTLTGGVASVPGEFAWVNPDAVMNTAGKFDMLVRFTPSSSVTYNTVDFEIEVEVVVCDTASGEHEYTEQKTNTDEHWNICAKCGVEESGSREAHKGGTATCTAKAKCEVCGEEYGAEPSHGETEIHNAKTASCDEEGYTGDKHCKVCGEKLESGTAIAKTAHTYENGKCKVCGAADPNYKPTSPQTGDNSNMALWIALLFISGMGIVATTVYGRKKKEIK